MEHAKQIEQCIEKLFSRKIPHLRSLKSKREHGKIPIKFDTSPLTKYRSTDHHRLWCSRTRLLANVPMLLKTTTKIFSRPYSTGLIILAFRLWSCLWMHLVSVAHVTSFPCVVSHLANETYDSGWQKDIESQVWQNGSSGVVTVLHICHPQRKN